MHGPPREPAATPQAASPAPAPPGGLALTLALSLLGPTLVYVTLVALSDARLTFLLYHGLVCLGAPAADLLLVRRLPLHAAVAELGLVGGAAPHWPHAHRPDAPRRPSIDLRLGLALGTVAFLATLGFFLLLGRRVLDPESIRSLLEAWHLQGISLPVLLTLLILANAVAEEVFWRGWLLPRWRQAAGPAVALAATSVLYASYHALTTARLFSAALAAPLTASVLGAGLLWGWLRLRRGSLLAPLVSHLLADAAIMAVYVLLVL